MTFEEAVQQYARLQHAYSSGQISWPEFEKHVSELVVQDASGNWWRLEGRSGQWLMWNGTSWVAGPGATAAASSAAATGNAADSGGKGYDLQPPGKTKQRFGDIIAVAGSTAMAAGMYYYSTLDRNTKPDITTPGLMVLMPLLLIVLRKPLDKFLQPIQAVRRKVPPLVLAGFGIAIPFLIASALYPRYTQFEYLSKSYVFSSLLSYVVLRTPPGANSGREASVGSSH